MSFLFGPHCKQVIEGLSLTKTEKPRKHSHTCHIPRFSIIFILKVFVFVIRLPFPRPYNRYTTSGGKPAFCQSSAGKILLQILPAQSER